MRTLSMTARDGRTDMVGTLVDSEAVAIDACRSPP